MKSGNEAKKKSQPDLYVRAQSLKLFREGEFFVTEKCVAIAAGKVHAASAVAVADGAECKIGNSARNGSLRSEFPPTVAEVVTHPLPVEIWHTIRTSRFFEMTAMYSFTIPWNVVSTGIKGGYARALDVSTRYVMGDLPSLHVYSPCSC